MTSTPDTPNQVDAVDEILAPIHDNGQDGLALCSYEVGRWPKPHTCGLPEAKAKLNALLVAARISENDWFFATTKKWLTKLDRTIPDELGAELQEHYKELEKQREANHG